MKQKKQDPSWPQQLMERLCVHSISSLNLDLPAKLEEELILPRSNLSNHEVPCPCPSTSNQSDNNNKTNNNKKKSNMNNLSANSFVRRRQHVVLATLLLVCLSNTTPCLAQDSSKLVESTSRGNLRNDNNNNNNNNRNLNQNNFVLNILHVNDHHSHLAEESFRIPEAQLPQVSNEARRVRYGGYPRLVRLFRQAKSSQQNVLKLHAGDSITGNALYRVFGNQPDVDQMHQVCYDAVNFGNHEFDDGDANLARFVESLTNNKSPCQNTRVLCANVAPGNNSPLKPLQKQGYIAPFFIKNINGHKIGIIGVDTRNKTMQNSSPDPGTTLTDERTAIRKYVDKLTKRGVDKIIVLSHLGWSNDVNWMVKIPGVDVVIGGHSHTLLGKSLPNVLKPHSSYPQTRNQKSNGKKICIATAWKHGHGLGRLRVEFDANGDVVSCGGEYVIPYQPSPSISAAEQATVNNYLAQFGSTFQHVTQEPNTLSKLRSYLNNMNNNAMYSKVVSYQDETLCNDAIPGQGRSTSCSGEKTAVHGSAACHVVATSMLNSTVEADIAIQNAGGCRADIYAGNFTYAQAMDVVPYTDTLVILRVTGTQIHAVLEQALDLTFVGQSYGSYPYASGLRFDVNASETIGYRVSNLQLNSRLAEGTWNDIDHQAQYTVVTNSFLAAGRDGYSEFSNAGYQIDTNTSYLDAFVSYVEALGGVATPDPEDMSTHSYEGPTTGHDDGEDDLDMWNATIDYFSNTVAKDDGEEEDDIGEVDSADDPPGSLWTGYRDNRNDVTKNEPELFPANDATDDSNNETSSSPNGKSHIDGNFAVASSGSHRGSGLVLLFLLSVISSLMGLLAS